MYSNHVPRHEKGAVDSKSSYVVKDLEFDHLKLRHSTHNLFVYYSATDAAVVNGRQQFPGVKKEKELEKMCNLDLLHE